MTPKSTKKPKSTTKSKSTKNSAKSTNSDSIESVKIYIFKIVLKHQKSKWAKIKIRGNNSLVDFDEVIREAFNHDTWDHLSEFVEQQGRYKKSFGVIYPDGGGEGADITINSLDLNIGDGLMYIYDFGSNIEHIIILEDIYGGGGEVEAKGVERDEDDGEEDEEDSYDDLPQVIAKSKTRVRYCKNCKKNGVKVPATLVCVDCWVKTKKKEVLCDECAEKYHSDHFVEELN